MSEGGAWGGSDEFPPRRLLGPASDSTVQPMFATARSGSGAGDGEITVHPMVARRGLDFLWYLCKTSSRVTYDMLTVGPAGGDDDSSIRAGGTAWGAAGLVSSVAEPKGPSKGKGKGKRGSGRGKGKQAEAMTVAGAHLHKK